LIQQQKRDSNYVKTTTSSHTKNDMGC